MGGGGKLRLTPQAHGLLRALQGNLHERRIHTLTRGPRADLAQRLSPVPEFQAAPIPDDLRGRRAELIVEASDLGMLRRALEGDADAVVIDFDDTFSPTLENVQAAYDALPWALATGKPVLVRPRALYAVEEHVTVARYFGCAALVDLCAALTARPGRVPHVYIPKLEYPAEAQFWHAALRLAEHHLRLPPDSVRVCLQIETFSGLHRAGALLYEVRTRAYGLNAGRWDYVFSLVKSLGDARTTPLPPRSQLTMDVDAMRAYAEHLVLVCRQHGAEAIGGTAAVFPDPADPQPALNAVLADKRREAAQGFTAAWAGLPELVGAVREGFGGVTPQSASLTAPPKGSRDQPLPPLEGTRRAAQQRCPEGPDSQSCEAEGSTGQDMPLHVTHTRLLALPTPDHIPLAELQDSIGLALDVFAAWFGGRGVITRKGRIEDTATGELARALVWQWVKVGARLDDGTRLTRERYLHERRARMADGERAATLLDHLVLSDQAKAYFPRQAQLLGV